MQHRGRCSASRTALGVLGEQLEIERAETLAEQVRARPRPLGGDALGEQHADQERVRRVAKQRVGLGVAGERLPDLRRAERLELAAIRKQRVGDDALLVGQLVVSAARDQNSSTGSWSSVTGTSRARG